MLSLRALPQPSPKAQSSPCGHFSGRSRKSATESEHSPATSAVKAGSGRGSEPDTDRDSGHLQPLSDPITKAFDADELNPDVVPSVHGEEHSVHGGGRSRDVMKDRVRY